MQVPNQPQVSNQPLHNSSLKLVIAATFTADPLIESLEFWMQKLGIAAQIELAPYNQLFQQLLDPTSFLTQNQNGINIVLLRFEDWLRFDVENTPVQATEKVQRYTHDLISALVAVVERTGIPHLVVICPGASPSGAEAKRSGYFQEMEALMQAELGNIKGLLLMTPAELADFYPVNHYYDPKTDKLGHIPYTEAYFAALGTLLARKLHALQYPPYKVIALDCDNTLWKGVCGEVGAKGIEIGRPWCFLQEFMVAQQQAGMLLCLCSKNVESDVGSVFQQRIDMPLKWDQIVSSRINWQAKSENLKALATELNLGLDSFILIDDNPVECSEVKANCPEVLCLCLPAEAEQIPNFLKHVWAFDRVRVTEADQQRTQLYKQNVEREHLRQNTTSFADFLASLQLKVQINAQQPHQLGRVAQLTQRTNQFNATTIRRSEAEIAHLCEAGYNCWAVEVSDRFGDYGLVGVILFYQQDKSLEVDTFLLSCRVLGRGVEHQIVAALGKVALEQGLQQVMFHYKPTAKNQPVHNFLESIGHNFQLSTEDGLCFSFPASAITSLHYNPSPSGEFRDLQSETTSTPPSQPQTLDRTVKLEQIATAYSDASRILKAIKLWKKEQSPFQSRLQPVIPPQTSLQACLVQIWRDALQVEQVGIQDHYFEDLGGTSLKAVEIFVQIQQLLSLELPMTVLLQYPTVEKLAQFLDQAQVLEPWPALVPIQPNGHKTPVVCVHGGYGDVLGLQAIAKRLPADQPFYALRGIGLDGLQAPLPTIETMAARYIAELQTLQSQGPYQLMGICIGGTVAFEMAQQLIAKGQEVKWLALVDTVYPSFENYFLTRYTYYFRQGRRPLWLNRQDALYYLYDLCFYRIPSYRHRFPTWSSLIIHIQNKVKQQFLKSPADQSKKSVIEDRLPFPEVADQNHQAQIKNQFYETFLSALERYQPQPYPGRIDFFLPILQTYLPTAYPHQIQSLWRKEKQILAPSQLLFGWNQVAAEFKIHEMKVRHGVMLEEPHINTVVEQLQEVLNKL